MRSSAIDPILVDFLDPEDHGLPGKIGLTAAPGKKDLWDRDLEADLDRLRNHYKTDLLVSLLEPHEYEMLGIPELPDRARARGIENVRFPIPDLCAPPTEALTEFLELVKSVVEAARSGRTVVIHCRGGLGRSGTLAAACLVLLGRESGDAIARVRTVRPGAVEMREQERWVGVVAAELLNPATSRPTGPRRPRAAPRPKAPR